MHIVQLQAENVKRLVAVTINPQGNLVVIGGANAAGKSSVLDSIQYALGGSKHMPDEPLRRGAENGKIVLDLGNIVVRRTFTNGGGSSLVVENAEGLRFPSPQAVLDELCGKLTFDPLAFMQKKPIDQLDELRKLTGIKLEDLDNSREAVVSLRRDLGKRRAIVEAKLETLEPVPEGTPAEELSLKDLLEQRTEALAIDRRSAETQSLARDAKKAVAEAEEEKVWAEKAIGEAEAKLTQAKQHVEACSTKLDVEIEASKRLQIAEKNLPGSQIQVIELEIGKLEDINKQVRAAARRRELEGERLEIISENQAKGKEMKTLDNEKRERIGAAKLPVDGIGFDTNGITLNDLPFEQASFAQRLKVSVAMGIATNPKLKVMLVRDGSALDDKNLANLAKLVEDADCQLWLERVGDDEMAQVIIEDGSVRAPIEVSEEEDGPVQIDILEPQLVEAEATE